VTGSRPLYPSIADSMSSVRHTVGAGPPPSSVEGDGPGVPPATSASRGRISSASSIAHARCVSWTFSESSAASSVIGSNLMFRYSSPTATTSRFELLLLSTSAQVSHHHHSAASPMPSTGYPIEPSPSLAGPLIDGLTDTCTS
jgi:hypothetical protein